MKKYFLVSLAALALSAVTSNAMAINVNLPNRQVRLNGFANAGRITPFAFGATATFPPRCQYALLWYNQFNPNQAVICNVLEGTSLVGPACAFNQNNYVNANVTNDGLPCAGWDALGSPQLVGINGLMLNEMPAGGGLSSPNGTLSGWVTFVAYGPFPQFITIG